MKHVRRLALLGALACTFGCEEGLGPAQDPSLSVSSERETAPWVSQRFLRLVEIVKAAGNSEATALLDTAALQRDAARAAAEAGDWESARAHFDSARAAMRGAVERALPSAATRGPRLGLQRDRLLDAERRGEGLASLEARIAETGNEEAVAWLRRAEEERAAAHSATDSGTVHRHLVAFREAVRTGLRLAFPGGFPRAEPGSLQTPVGVPVLLRPEAPHRLLGRFGRSLTPEQAVELKAAVQQARAALAAGDPNALVAHRDRVLALVQVAPTR